MKIPLYLAMTAAEFAANQPLPGKIAWMACHFSPYCTGLSNIPTSLPPRSLLIVNDITPIHNHDPQRIFDTLLETVKALQCAGVLLDFQREGYKECASLAARLTELPVPVAVSEYYAQGLSCPVFVAPPPLRIPLAEYLSPWNGREIWLETALTSETVAISQDGCDITSFCAPDHSLPHKDDTLLCRYAIEVQPEQAKFHLQRTAEDLTALLQESQAYGVTRAVGLYQEFKDFPLFNSDDL